jgi:uncharacterized membrane protein
MKPFLIALIILCLTIPAIHAATIEGTVYTIDLEPARQAIVTVDSTPMQSMVAIDGTFSFSLPEGTYALRTVFVQDGIRYHDTQEVAIIDDGSYVVDVIVFPDLEEDNNTSEIFDDLDMLLLEQAQADAEEETPSASIPLSIIIIASILLILGLFLFLWYRRSLQSASAPIGDALKKEVLMFIERAGGRVTQKQIRQGFPVSEAKVSLVLTELEGEGIIKKFKQGKGNIIVLQHIEPDDDQTSDESA